MMLLNNLYTIRDFIPTENTINATVSVDAAHAIFEGHFPGQPVLPGVCMMQLVKELLEQYLNKDLQLVSAGQSKFLSMLDPVKESEIQANIQLQQVDEGVKVAAVLKTANAVLLKMNAVYR